VAMANPTPSPIDTDTIQRRRSWRVRVSSTARR